MTLTITATDKITDIDGVRCRVWDGTAADGVRCVVFVHRVAVGPDQDSAAFDRRLVELLPPGTAVPLRDVL